MLRKRAEQKRREIAAEWSRAEIYREKSRYRARADPCQAEEKSCWLISAEEQSRNRELGSASVRVTPESHTDWDVTVRSRVSSRK